MGCGMKRVCVQSETASVMTRCSVTQPMSPTHDAGLSASVCSCAGLAWHGLGVGGLPCELRPHDGGNGPNHAKRSSSFLNPQQGWPSMPLALRLRTWNLELGINERLCTVQEGTHVQINTHNSLLKGFGSGGVVTAISLRHSALRLRVKLGTSSL